MQAWFRGSALSLNHGQKPTWSKEHRFIKGFCSSWVSQASYIASASTLLPMLVLCAVWYTLHTTLVAGCRVCWCCEPQANSRIPTLDEGLILGSLSAYPVCLGIFQGIVAPLTVSCQKLGRCFGYCMRLAVGAAPGAD